MTDTPPARLQAAAAALEAVDRAQRQWLACADDLIFSLHELAHAEDTRGRATADVKVLICTTATNEAREQLTAAQAGATAALAAVREESHG